MSLFQLMLSCAVSSFTDAATTEIYTLSLHDAFRSSHHVVHALVMLPRFPPWKLASLHIGNIRKCFPNTTLTPKDRTNVRDRKSTRLNSSHVEISYAVFCLKKKKIKIH